MARPKSNAGKAKTRAPGGSGRSLVWLQGLLCGALVACAPGTALLLGILLAPALVMLAFDRGAGRPVARTMLLFAGATAVSPVLALWTAGPSTDTAIALGSDARTLASAWGAAAGGWLLTELAPFVTRIGLDAAALARQRRLRALRDRCATEWGMDSEPG